MKSRTRTGPPLPAMPSVSLCHGFKSSGNRVCGSSSREAMRTPALLLALALALALCAPRARAGSPSCREGCSLALGSYYLTSFNSSSNNGLNLTYIASLFQTTYPHVQQYNPSITNADFLTAGTRVAIPFPSCDCLSSPFDSSATYLAHSFNYTALSGDTYNKIATQHYANLTTSDWLSRVNSIPATRIQPGDTISVTVNCSCGDASISRDYGLFETYPLRPGENLSSVAADVNFTGNATLLQSYNPGVNFTAGTGIVFVPVRDLNQSYRPLNSSKGTGISGGAIAGISVAIIVVLLLLAFWLYFRVYRKKSVSLLPSSSEGTSDALDKSLVLNPQAASASELTNFTVDKSVVFSYEELAKATDDFSMTNKIGGGGFGDVYYAELRGEKAAIKKMDMQASREFLAELKVLTRVHHLNLVRLIGYCTDNSLFLVYEFIDNGNLSEHLRGSGRKPLPWPARVQIALDSARGLEYIHEHTVPVYIHRDIKSANILIDKNFRAKVADFGLAKLTEVGNSSVQTRLVGTFGYMPPEYAQYGDVSPKVDVYAFGVVLYELISSKEAVVKTASVTETKGLVAMFEDALAQPDSREGLRKIVDPRLGDDYPIDSVHKMAQLARACTQEDPQLRPSMRSIVVALMTLTSSTEDWDVGTFFENQALVNLMSGR